MEQTVLIKRSIEKTPSKDGTYIACRSTYALGLWIFRNGHWRDEEGKVYDYDLEYWYEEIPLSSLIEEVMPTQEDIDKAFPYPVKEAMQMSSMNLHKRAGIEWIKNKLTHPS